ncbi:hypothetical protein RCL1_004196 [Eukaryota sp. TZLM3-RCL]
MSDSEIEVLETATSHTNLDIQSQPLDRTPKRKLPEDISAYFQQALKRNSISVLDPQHLQCVKCNVRKVFSINTSSGNLRSHLIDFHDFGKEKKRTDSSTCAPPRKKLENSKITEFLTPAVQQEQFVFDVEQFLDKLVDYIVDSYSSFASVKKKSFLRLISTINPEVKVPSRKVLRGLTVRKFEEKRESIKRLLNSIESNISLTTDMWTSCSNDPYICVVAHYITNDYSLQSVLLDIQSLEHPHTDVAIAQKLREITEFFGIQQRIESFTTDNAGNIVNAVDSILESDDEEPETASDQCNQRCLAHICNLIVKSGMVFLSEITTKVRSFVGKLHHSSMMKQQLCSAAEELGRKYKNMPMDVATRWNSTFDMLSAYRDQLLVIQHYYDTHKPKNIVLPTNQELLVLPRVISLLQPFFEITTALSGATYTTIADSIGSWSDLEEAVERELSKYDATLLDLKMEDFKALKKTWIQTICNDDHLLLIGLAAKAMKQKMELYTSHVFTDKAITSAVLDPSIKMNPDLWIVGTNFRSVKATVYRCLSNYGLSENQSNDTEPDEHRSVSHNLTRRRKKRVVEASTSRLTKIEHELEDYLLLRSCDVDDPLQWWSCHQRNFPLLSRVIKSLFTVQATSVSSERLFSSSGMVITKTRTNLNEDSVRSLVCLKAWKDIDNSSAE